MRDNPGFRPHHEHMSALPECPNCGGRQSVVVHCMNLQCDWVECKYCLTTWDLETETKFRRKKPQP